MVLLGAQQGKELSEFVSKRWDAVRAACDAVIEELGFELAEMEYAKEPDTGWVLTFYIHKPGGVNLNDCEQVSRAIEPIVDELDEGDDAYYLSVSSLGLDRPFKKTADYARYLNEEIELRFYVPVDIETMTGEKEVQSTGANKKKAKKSKAKELHGVLRSAEEEEIRIEIEGISYNIAREGIALARPYLKW